MRFCLLLLSIIIIPTSLLRPVELSEQRIPSLGPDGKLVNLIVMQVEKDADGNLLIQHIVGVNGFEQVSFLLNCDKGNVDKNNIRIGPQYVCNVMTRISNIDGIFKTEFLPLSAGSGLVIVGKDKGMKAIDDLPLGLALDRDHPELKFVLIARVNADESLPTNSDLARKWTNLAHIQSLIADGSLVVVK